MAAGFPAHRTRIWGGEHLGVHQLSSGPSTQKSRPPVLLCKQLHQHPAHTWCCRSNRLLEFSTRKMWPGASCAPCSSCMAECAAASERKRTKPYSCIQPVRQRGAPMSASQQGDAYANQVHHQHLNSPGCVACAQTRFLPLSQKAGKAALQSSKAADRIRKAAIT